MGNTQSIALTSAELAAYANRDDDDFAESCLNEAKELIDHYTRGCRVPEPILRRSVLEVGSNLLKRVGTDGIASYDSGNMEPLRITRDPLQAARDILAPYTRRAVA